MSTEIIGLEKNEELSSLISKINLLSLEIEALTNDNKNLNNLLNGTSDNERLEKDVCNTTPQTANVSICVKSIALKAEIKAMDYIFPDCRKKPYCFRSYRNLCSFVTNPTIENASSSALMYWSEVDDSVKDEIEDRIDYMRSEFTYFKTYIQDLKNYTGDFNASSIEELKLKIMESNTEMSDEIIEAIDECVKFNEVNLVITSAPFTFDDCELSARDVAVKTEIKAMDFIFPDCRKKPYCFRSFGNLISFISNPTDEYSSHIAPEQWNSIDENVKQDIRNKIDYVSNKCEYLKTYINDLKYGGKIATQTHKSVESMKTSFINNGEGELLESLEECLMFLEQTFTSNIVISKSKNNSRSFGEEKPIIINKSQNQNQNQNQNQRQNNSSDKIIETAQTRFLNGFSRGF
jgi:hypothetical protein